VTIGNAVPFVYVAVDQSANKGRSTSFNLGSFSDAADDGPWEVTVNWGDGSSNTSFQANTPGEQLTAQHTYADDGAFTVTVRVAEAGGTRVGSDTFGVAVADLTPIFAQEVEGRVPQYEASEAGPRISCSGNRCFFVKTEADNERSLVLIIQDIIQSKHMDDEPDTTVIVFEFYGSEGDRTLPTAYAFRDVAFAEEVLSEEELRRATVINGVYFVQSEY
jgi:PKD repeat protein